MTHAIEVVEIKEILPHPNADALGIVKVWNYQCVVRLADWKPGDLAYYVPPDFVVPDTAEFQFLGEHKRIRCRRLRGVWSQGLLMPAPALARPGDDVSARIGIIRYIPPSETQKLISGDAERGPYSHFNDVYDIESWHRYPEIIRPDEQVIVTEKIHGCNARYVFANGRMYCGSRTQWKKESGNSCWWKVLRRYPQIVEFCTGHPNEILLGEIYGPIQDLSYGTTEPSFAAFDIRQPEGWTNWDTLDRWSRIYNLPIVPTLWRGEYARFSPSLAEGRTLMPGATHVREGCVIRPVTERTDHVFGRVQLKCVGNGYLERA